MNLRILSGLLLLATMILSSSTTAAQNPLRQNAPSSTTSSRSVHPDTTPIPTDQQHQRAGNVQNSSAGMPAEIRRALYDEPASSHTQPTRTQAFPQNPPQSVPRVDPQVGQSSYNQPLDTSPRNDSNMDRIVDMLDGLQSRNPNEVLGQNTSQVGDAGARYSEPARDETTARLQATLDSQKQASGQSEPALPKTDQDNNKFHDLMENIAYNTLLVLGLAIGFILIARPFLKRKASANLPDEPARFQIISTIKVGAKSSLMLVQVADDRLVVATDAGGIKSVLRLTESFAGTLGSLEEEEEEEDTPTQEFVMPPAPQAPPASPASPQPKAAYSLASIGQAAMKSAPKPSPPKSETADSEAEIRKKMEAALLEHGFKDLILKTIQAES